MPTAPDPPSAKPDETGPSGRPGPSQPGDERDGRPARDARAAPRRIAIAGAAGFVGQALAAELARDCQVLALGRRYSSDAPESPAETGIQRRRCDLFSLAQTERALEGVDVAVYLVHSMSPNARLTQGRFEDLDWLLADNFARAARHAGVKRIVYLGGLLPPGASEGAAPGADAEQTGDARPASDTAPDGRPGHPEVPSLSPHLASRLEVEKTLGSTGIPVTAVRAGLVVGAEGSSLNLLVRLVERLPLMICPSWTSSRTQPIALSDVTTLLAHCCRDDATAGRICDVGGPDVLSYREMMQVTARVLGRRRPMLPVPFVTPALSELWVSLVTGTSRALVRPLIESLRHPMLAQDRWLQDELGLDGTSFEAALRDSLRRSRVYKRSVVRSVQRLPLPPGRSAAWVGEEYPRWLERRLPGFLRADVDDRGIRLGVFFTRRPFLILGRRAQRSDDRRSLLGVDGGLLARREPGGDPRLEFRATADGRYVIAALQDFEPRLPWWLYAISQAPLHATIMWAYQRYLARLADETSAATATPEAPRDSTRSANPPSSGEPTRPDPAHPPA